MRWEWKYAAVTVVLLLIEICIALFVRDTFIRPFMGDLLVVVLLYYGFRTISKASGFRIALGVLLFAFSVEFLQYFKIVSLLGWEDISLARIIIGSTFDWLDLLAYLLGVVLSVAIDYYLFPNFTGTVNSSFERGN